MKFLFSYIFVLLCIILNNSLHGIVITVSNNNDSGPGSLRDALQTANDGDIIRSDTEIGDITLNSKLPIISKNITIETSSTIPQEINADNHRAFVIKKGKIVTIKNFNILNGHALGGKGGDAKDTCCAGGAGGGGLGAGGAVFVAENAFLTLDGRISLMDNSAEGGKGGGLVSTSVPSGSGGAGGGGGSFSDIDPNGLDPTSTTGANGGGDNAGMGGLPPSAGGFGGGGGGSSKNDSSTKGGDGGFGGGGAGSGNATSIIPSGDGGDGGFGGGGGGSGQTGGSGGNGGLYGGTGQTPAALSQGAGGGGAGLGGAVFIQDKGNVTIKSDLFFNTNAAVAGTGFNNGEAHGKDIFMMSGSTLTFDLSNNTTISSNIESDQGVAGGSGGGVTKTGFATLIFSGTNTYSGGTNLLEGVLSVSKNSNLGKASDKINFNGGTLQATDTFSSTRDVTLTGTGTIGIDNSKILTISGVVSGAGSLIKQDTGTLILSGVNTYSGGTNLLGGILSISADANLGSGKLIFSEGILQSTDTFSSAKNVTLDVTLTSSGTIDVINGKTLTMSGIFSDLGSLTKQNTGTLILSGVNTYSGGTTVSAGVLQGTTNGLQGNITNNAAVVFDQTATGTYSGEMSGTGSLTKQNTGTLILSGVNTYLGGTTVNAGVLQGTTSSLKGDIKNNAFVVFDQTATGTYSGEMSGTGSLTKQNTGTLILSGVNTYSGGTNLLGGILSISADDHLGPGPLNFNGGALQAIDTFTSTRDITITGSGTIDVSNSKTLTMSGVLSGIGSLTKRNTGTLILSGVNTYSGGTNLLGGILSISADANLGPGPLRFSGGILQAIDTFTSTRDVTLRSSGVGTIDVINDKTLTMSGVLSGMGSLTKQNTGTLILSGVNTYSGGTTISAGVLQGTTSSLQGDIKNDAFVVFDQTATGIYSGAMSGMGSLTKQNTGTLILSGVNTYSGGTTISAGVLQGTTSSLQGDIINNASVIFDHALGGTYSGEMSGTGSLTKNNIGTLILSGPNTYSGGTNLLGGILSISADDHLGPGPLNFNGGALQAIDTFTSTRDTTITGSGTIDVSNSKTLTMSGVLSGMGTLTKQNTGTLILSGVNTYSGGTNLLGGILSISADDHLGPGPLNFNGGALQAIDTFTSTRDTTITGSGTVDVSNSKTLTMSGVLSGMGTLTKQNTGTLILSGMNTYSGGTTVSAGVLQGTTSSLQGDIINNASVIFDQTSTGTYSGVMSGTGTLTKQNTGTLILSGMNTYSGGTTVSAGALQGTTNSLQGDIINNASVIFDQTSTGTYSGVMSGTGTLIKQNTGKSILSGTNTYTGITNVRQGDLEVNGSLLSSIITVFPAGILQGTGNVKTVQNNGTVSPGSSIGTFNIDGDYTQDSSAFLLIEIDDTPLASDLLLISGAANLNGAVALNPHPGMYEPGMTFTFLEASTITGQFSRLLGTSSLKFALNYLSDTVQVVILFQQPILPIPIDQLGWNAKNIANDLFSCSIPLSSSLTPILRTLLKTSPSEFPQALLRLGPQQFGGLSLSNLQSHVRMSRSMNRTKDVFDQSYFSECHTRWNHPFVWLTPMGHYYKQNKMQGQTPFTDKTYGVTAGYGITFFDHLLVGGGIGYSHSDIDWDDNQGDATIHSVFLSPSVGYIGQYGYVGLVVTGSRSFYDVNRNVRFSTFKDSAHNDHKSYNLLTGLELGTHIKIPEAFQKNLYFSPVASLDYVNIFERGYQESGAGPINLSVQNKHSAFLHPKILFKLLKEIKKNSLCVLPSLYIGYSSNIPLTNGTYTSRFYKQQACEKRFKTQSYDKTTHQMLLGAKLKMLQKTNFESTIKYEAGLGSHYHVQEINLNLSRQF